jgi:hypothetical protein
MPQKPLPLIISLKRWREQNGFSQSGSLMLICALKAFSALVLRRFLEPVRDLANDDLIHVSILRKSNVLNPAREIADGF